MQTKRQALEKLKKSRFRSSFHLKEADKLYVRRKGMEVIGRHAEEIVRKRLAPAVIPNDGRQTPMKGHPVFIAQHACACCCRGCMRKWYRVPEHTQLTDEQIRKTAELLTEWIREEMEN